MRLSIRYRADYRYERRVSLSPHSVRLFPRADFHIRVERCSLEVPGASLSMRRDLFDNIVAVCFFPEAIQNLSFALDLDLAIEERNPFGFLLTSDALELPVIYSAHERAVLAPFMGAGMSGEELPKDLRAAEGEPTVEALVRINSALPRLIAYERREEGDPLPPSDTLRRASGSCRDYSALLLAMLRGLGMAARVASGYLWEPEPGPDGLKAENALHAWVEVFLPGAGWVGMDPTSGVLADHHRLAAAVGLLPADIAPISGHYYGDTVIGSELDTRLEAIAA